MAGIGIDTESVSKVVDAQNAKSGNTLDKDAFLKLLVTQMQYQDPLEPTSNTEYMSQLAQFSTVEQLQNLSALASTNQHMNLTGQYVILNVPDSSGKVNQVNGLVDYVTLKDGKAYFHIGDDYYPADYLDSVVSLDYLEYLVKNGADTDSSSENTNNGGVTDTDKTGDVTGNENDNADDGGDQTEGTGEA